jgi:3',5'-cyclic AMP phosphodiesterase CpdA
MLLVQMTDFHVAAAGSVLTERYRTDERLAAAVAHVRALDPAPDVVVCTGDLVDAGSAAEYARLRELLRPLASPVYVVPGNHDEREALRRAFADRGYFPAVGPLNYAVDVGPIRIVALDTNVPDSGGGRLGADTLAWLDATLAAAPDRPTVVVQHHPPMATGIAWMDDMGLEDAAAEAAIVARHPHVERILCGHLHRPIAARVGGTIASTCPSTAHQVALDLRRPGQLAIVAEPPAVQLHAWADGRLVSHVSYVGDYGVADVVGGA